MLCSQEIQVFDIFSHLRIYQIRDIMTSTN